MKKYNYPYLKNVDSTKQFSEVVMINMFDYSGEEFVLPELIKKADRIILINLKNEYRKYFKDDYEIIEK